MNPSRTATEPIRVLTIIDSLVPGGAERSLEALAPVLGARGVMMEVAHLKRDAGLQQKLEAAGCLLHDLSGPGGRTGWLRRAHTLIRRRRPDLVHTTLFDSNVVGRAAARIAGVPVVTSLVSDAYGPSHIDNPLLKPWKVRACQAIDALTAQIPVRFHANARHVADVMAKRLRIDRGRIDVVPRGRDPEALGAWSQDRRERTRTALGIGPDDPVVMTAARHEYQKGLDLLVQAFARADRPQASLVIAGREAGATKQVREAIESAGLEPRVRLLGHRDDVPDLLCAADLFVLPSRREGFPGILLEAMAMECPILAFDLPGAREAVGSDGAATLVPAGDVEALAGGISDLLADPVRRKGQAEAAAARFRGHFTIGVIADQMVGFYRRALQIR